MDGNLFEQKPETGWFTAHCDGGSRGNPGPAGFGAVIEDPEGRIVARLSEFLGLQTNNYAEYQGLLAVLAWAAEHGVSRLRIFSDSELMVRQMKGIYKVASPILRPLWQEARQRAARFDAFEMRHTLRGGNKEADRLANEAMDRGMRKPAGGLSEGLRTPSSQAATKVTAPEIFHGFVKNGVIHLVNGELPEGTRVKVTRDK